MAETKVIMPQLGESIFEGTITKWLKKVGDKVARDESLFEISTDKIDSEIPSPAAGTLQEILVKEGATVQINTVVAVIGDGDGASAAKPAEAKAAEPKPAEPKAAEPKAVEPKAAEVKPAAAAAAAPPKAEKETEAEAETDDRLASSPLVRRIAKERGVDLALLAGKGTGVGGRITKTDILSFIEQGGGKETPPPPSSTTRPAAPATAAASAGPAPMTFSGEVERVPMTPMRKAIAERMVLSRRMSAHVVTFFEVDCTRIMRAREKLKPEFERAGVRLTVTPFFILAAGRALKKFPIVNSSLDGETIVYKRDVNIGVAVNLDWGLIVPVIKNVEAKNLQAIARAVNELGERARTKKLTPDDVQNGTFTITNPGQTGALANTPVINQPQVAIMGMGGIKKRAVVIDDAIAIRSMIVLSLSFDHRVIDGAVADQFMADVQQQLENWES